MVEATPKLNEHDFTKIFLSFRPWVFGQDKDSRIGIFSDFLWVQPYRLPSLKLEQINQDALIKAMHGYDAPYHLKMIRWPNDGVFALWGDDCRHIGHTLIALFDERVVEARLKNDAWSHH